MLKPFKKLFFGTAGIPISAKDSSTEKGISQIRKLSLDALELEFVKKIYIDEGETKKIFDASRKNKVVISSHAPYFINLNSKEKKKIYASINYITKSAIITSLCGGWSTCFHPGYYMKSSMQEAYKKIKDNLKKIVNEVSSRGHRIWIRPEVSGRNAQFGTLSELLKLSQELEQVMPCIDFAHLHARSNGKFNSKDEFKDVLDKVEKTLGKEGLKNMHIHVSGIAYNEKGEKHHLNLEDSDFNYTSLCSALKEFKVGGIVISESPNLEYDALLLKEAFEKA